jgi:dCTP deaminase
VLNAAEILQRLVLGDDDPEKVTIVPEPDSATVLERGGSSIDLRLGRWFRSFRQSETSHVSLVKLTADGQEGARASRALTKEHFVPFRERFVLHPGRFILGTTLEWLRLPNNLSAYVSGKSALGRNGLVIETAAGIHPKFSGCLTLELANVGEVPLALYPGMQICQIFFHRTEPSRTARLGSFSGRRKPSTPPPADDPVFTKITGLPGSAVNYEDLLVAIFAPLVFGSAWDPFGTEGDGPTE